MKGRKKRSLKSLRAELDRVFSLFIRTRDADENGMGACITCGKWRKLEAGHYVKRRNLAGRWHEMNVAGQCSFCNRWLDGAADEFYFALEKKYGTETAQSIRALKGKTVKLSREDYEQMIERYK